MLEGTFSNVEAQIESLTVNGRLQAVPWKNEALQIGVAKWENVLSDMCTKRRRIIAGRTCPKVHFLMSGLNIRKMNPAGT